MVSCQEGPTSVDLVVKRTESSMKYNFETIKALLDEYFSTIKNINGSLLSKLTHVIGKFIVNSADDESDSYYSLHLEGVTHSSIVADQDLMS